jgi:hypothetical protein
LILEWVPPFGGGGEIHRGDGEGLLIGEKNEGDMEAAGKVFLAFDPLYHYFFIGDGKGELLKLL